MTIIERLEEKVTRQESKVAERQKNSLLTKNNLETAMFATFKKASKHQSHEF